MRRNPWIPALAIATLLIAPLAAAQTPQGQVEDAAAYADKQAQDARDDPQRYAENGTNSSWQSQQANWTLAWTCMTAYAVNEDAGEAAEEATNCPAPDSAQAGEDNENQEDEANQTQATAEEARNDTETAVRDEAAAAQAFVNDTANDPENATSHLATFLNRTLMILERLIGLPIDGATLVADGVGALAGLIGDGSVAIGVGVKDASLSVGSGLLDGVLLVGDAIATVGSSIASGAQALGHGIQAGASAIGHGVATMASAAADGAQSLAQASFDAVQSLIGTDASANAPTDVPAKQATGTVDDTTDGILERAGDWTPDPG